MARRRRRIRREEKELLADLCAMFANAWLSKESGSWDRDDFLGAVDKTKAEIEAEEWAAIQATRSQFQAATAILNR